MAEADELAVAELDVEVEAELDELLLHPAAASPVHAMVSRATAGALFVVKNEIIPRTLPLIVAWRKESRHHFGDSAIAGPNGLSHRVITPWHPHRTRALWTG